jgi:hypothetical protein
MMRIQHGDDVSQHLQHGQTGSFVHLLVLPFLAFIADSLEQTHAAIAQLTRCNPIKLSGMFRHMEINSTHLLEITFSQSMAMEHATSSAGRRPGTGAKAAAICAKANPPLPAISSAAWLVMIGYVCECV